MTRKQIEKLTSILTKSEKLSKEKKEELKNSILRDLDSLLGGKKNEFANIVLTTKATELIDIFNAWIESTKNSKDFKFDKEDLSNLSDPVINLRTAVLSESQTVSFNQMEGNILHYDNALAAVFFTYQILNWSL